MGMIGGTKGFSIRAARLKARRSDQNQKNEYQFRAPHLLQDRKNRDFDALFSIIFILIQPPSQFNLSQNSGFAASSCLKKAMYCLSSNADTLLLFLLRKETPRKSMLLGVLHSCFFNVGLG
jgi:hypothetical protein